MLTASNFSDRNTVYPKIAAMLLESLRLRIFLLAMCSLHDYLKLVCKKSVLDKCGLPKLVLTLLFFLLCLYIY